MQISNKNRNGLWPMQYVFLIRLSAGGKKYVTRRSRVTYFLPPARIVWTRDRFYIFSVRVSSNHG